MAVSSFSKETKDKSTEVKACTASANEAKGKVQELASAAVQKVQDVASEVSHKAQDWASNVANQAQETASAAVDKTNDGIAAVGHEMNVLGGSVRKAAPQNGVMGSAAMTVADQLQAGGRYLEGHGLQEIGKDLTSLVRHYPIQSVLVGFGLGCLLGITLRRR
jgi:ElaB/YqjD/DUF883 family membrane-anchored ribosome-binding protein